jgi:hypothetical protein
LFDNTRITCGSFSGGATRYGNNSNANLSLLVENLDHLQPPSLDTPVQLSQIAEDALPQSVRRSDHVDADSNVTHVGLRRAVEWGINIDMGHSLT